MKKPVSGNDVHKRRRRASTAVKSHRPPRQEAKTIKERALFPAHSICACAAEKAAAVAGRAGGGRGESGGTLAPAENLGTKACVFQTKNSDRKGSPGEQDCRTESESGGKIPDRRLYFTPPRRRQKHFPIAAGRSERRRSARCTIQREKWGCQTVLHLCILFVHYL